jgi:N-carbamoylputrescine amidase
MAHIIRSALIQATLCEPVTAPVEKIKQAMIEKHESLIAKAVDRGAQIVCLQELFYGPYFCAEQHPKWYSLTERVPEGPTTQRFIEIARKRGIVLV